MGDNVLTALADAQEFSVENSKVTVVIKDGEGYLDYYWYEVEDIAPTEFKVSSVVTYFNIYGNPFLRNSNYEKPISLIELVIKPKDVL